MFYPALFLLCKKFFKDDHEALEALNDGMLKVFKNISMYNSQKGEFFNWAYTIVRNTALDKLKIINRLEFVELDDSLAAAITENPLQGFEWQNIYTLLD